MLLLPACHARALPSDIDWVDDAELALADLMDDQGRVPRQAASDAITRLAPTHPTASGRGWGSEGGTSLVGVGMIEQLFMLEVKEPSHEFDPESIASSNLNQSRRRYHALSDETREYKREIRDASNLRGTADFTELVTLLRQAVTAGCFVSPESLSLSLSRARSPVAPVISGVSSLTEIGLRSQTDEVHETTYVCSSCGHSAYEPQQAQKESAGFQWDGGHVCTPPQAT